MESVLMPGEKALLMSSAKHKAEKNLDVKGTLFLTSSKRIVFVTSKGTVRKQYNIHHSVNLANITNARIEKKMIGQRLVIDWNYKGRSYSYRYEGVSVPERWVKKIRNMKKKKGKLGQIKNKIVALLNSQELTEFSSIKDEFVGSSFKIPSDESIIKLLSEILQTKAVEGMIDRENKQFKHKITLEGRVIEKKVILERKVPTECFQCGAPLSDETVAWVGPNKVRCPNCSSVLEIGYEQIEM